MNRLIFVLAISLAVASSIAGKANATVYTETITVDAKIMSITHTTSPFLTNGFLQFTVPVVNLQPGDQYDLTVRFLPSQSITVICPVLIVQVYLRLETKHRFHRQQIALPT